MIVRFNYLPPNKYNMLKIYNERYCVTYNKEKPKEVMLEEIGVTYKNLNIESDTIDNIKTYYGMKFHDEIALNVGTPNYKQLRVDFNREHTHSDDEMRLFTRGNAKFCIKVESTVYELLVKPGDLISIPANVKHWFDAGESPDFEAIRFYKSNDGWVPQYVDKPQ